MTIYGNIDGGGYGRFDGRDGKDVYVNSEDYWPTKLAPNQAADLTAEGEKHFHQSAPDFQAPQKPAERLPIDKAEAGADTWCPACSRNVEGACHQFACPKHHNQEERAMSETTWKVGDWCVFDREIVQIKEIREGGSCSVSDGSFETSGRFLDRLRPLTLRNKSTAEWFAWHYGELSKLRGECGFNYPDISRYFSKLALQAMDGDKEDKTAFDAAQNFIRRAREYQSVIDGINLFR